MAAGRGREFPSPGRCFGKVILGQNKEILSLNSGQNRMPEEEYKSLNEVLDFDEFFVLCMEKKKKKANRFYLPWKDSSTA